MNAGKLIRPGLGSSALKAGIIGPKFGHRRSLLDLKTCEIVGTWYVQKKHCNWTFETTMKFAELFQDC
jgi:hypothetical protein